MDDVIDLPGYRRDCVFVKERDRRYEGIFEDACVSVCDMEALSEFWRRLLSFTPRANGARDVEEAAG